MPLGGYSGQNSSSIFAATDAHATSGGQFVLGGNPNLALLFPGGNVGGGIAGALAGGLSWGKVALIGAVVLGVVLLSRRMA